MGWSGFAAAAAGLALAAAWGAGTAQAQAQPAPASDALRSVASDAFLRTDTFRLWPGRAPKANSDDTDETPTLTLFHPPRGHESRSAVIVTPGGGYVGLAADLEGREVADWFTAHGVTAFVLKYRVGPRAPLPTPLFDGTRAVRFVRAHAAEFGVDPRRIGMIGFSAGGHLSAMTAVTADAGQPAAPDPVERVSSRPDFLILGYPWLEATDITPDGQSAYCGFAGKGCKPADYTSFTPLTGITAAFPPTFIYHTTDDGLVPVAGSLRLYSALVAAKVPVELHAFAHGPHGTGLGGADPALSRWPDLLEQWLRGLKLLDRNATGASR